MTTNKDQPRWDKIKEARWRIANGYYNMPFVVEEAVDRIISTDVSPSSSSPSPSETPHEDEQQNQDPSDDSHSA